MAVVQYTMLVHLSNCWCQYQLTCKNQKKKKRQLDWIKNSNNRHHLKVPPCSILPSPLSPTRSRETALKKNRHAMMKDTNNMLYQVGLGSRMLKLSLSLSLYSPLHTKSTAVAASSTTVSYCCCCSCWSHAKIMSNVHTLSEQHTHTHTADNNSSSSSSSIW